jgi:hypothetical protein
MWAVLIGVVLFVEAVVLWIAWLLGDWYEALRLHDIRDGGVVMWAWFFGFIRVLRHHPACSKSYLNYLATTPWQRGRPLPLGPVRLASQDLAVVGLLTAVIVVGNRLPLYLPAVGFLVGYLICLGWMFLRTGPWWAAWTIAFGLGLALRLAWWNAWAAAAALAVTVAASQCGLWQSWLAFPWANELQPTRRKLFDPDIDPLIARKRRERDRPFDAETTWPLAGLRFSLPERSLNPTKAWLSAALVGWWMYAVAGPLPHDPVDVHKFAGLMFTACAVVLALGRIVLYVASHHPPISIWGRFATRQYLIPAYDVVFVTPLIVATMGLPCYGALYLAGVPAITSAAITSTLLIGLACTGGPRLRAWQLTAPSRLVFTSTSVKELEQI